MTTKQPSGRTTLCCLAPLLGALAVVAVGCKDKGGGGGGDDTTVKVDGSSTVFPITQAVAEEFRSQGDARVTVSVSGTGGGFKKFCRGDIAVTGASRPVQQSEIDKCAEAGIEFIELPVAYDGIAVVVHPDNDWAKTMTVAELKKLWEPSAQGEITRWNQIRPDWPDKEIHLFGAGIDSGTYDYFTQAIVDREHASRGDFTSSEDDNVLVQGVSTDPLSLGFFGFAYYKENRDKLQIVGIDDGNPDNGAGAIEPSVDTVGGGSYQPLSRPLFIYVAKSAADRPAVKSFVEFYLDSGRPLVEEVGYIPLPDDAYKLVADRFANGVTGSLFADGAKVGVTVQELLGGS